MWIYPEEVSTFKCQMTSWTKQIFRKKETIYQNQQKLKNIHFSMIQFWEVKKCQAEICEQGGRRLTLKKPWRILTGCPFKSSYTSLLYLISRFCPTFIFLFFFLIVSDPSWRNYLKAWSKIFKKIPWQVCYIDISASSSVIEESCSLMRQFLTTST